MKKVKFDELLKFPSKILSRLLAETGVCTDIRNLEQAHSEFPLKNGETRFVMDAECAYIADLLHKDSNSTSPKVSIETFRLVSWVPHDFT